MIAIENSRWVAAMECIDRKLRPCLREFNTLKGISDDDYEGIRMPEKAIVEDPEGNRLQWHAKIIEWQGLW